MTDQQHIKEASLIITRPSGQADSLMKRLAAECLGQIRVKHLPLLEIQALLFSLPSAQSFDGAIFISRNAVDCFFRLAELPAMPILAVGERTARHLTRKVGTKIKYPEQMNAEGLLQMPELRDVENQNWLLIKGEGGRTLITKTLEQRGAKVHEINCYRRKLPDYGIQRQIRETYSESPSWLITSGEALLNLYRVLDLGNNPEHQTPIIVSSERLLKLGQQKGFVIIAQSAGASEIQLVQCVKSRFFSQE